MKLTVLTLCTFGVAALPAFAADDPIAVRQALMSSVGANAAVSGGMMKGEIPYDPKVGKAAIAAMNASALAFGDYFPEGSDQGGNTEASPKIWEDMDGFRETLGKFQAASADAMKAAGKDGPADVDAFKAAMGPVMKNCKSCHESYRVDK